MHFGEGLTECMRRPPQPLQTALLLDFIQNSHHPLRKKRFTGTIEKNRCFIRMFRTTVLVNILPKKFTYFWMQAYLTLFAPLPKDLDIAIVNVSNLQAAKLGTPHTPIEHNHKHDILTKS